MDIIWTDKHTTLSHRLALLYPHEDSARRLVDEAGIDKTNLKYEGKAAVDRWHEIVREADRQEKLVKLIDAARTPYQNDEIMKELRDQFNEQMNRPLQPKETSELKTISANLPEGRLPFRNIETARKSQEPSKEDAELREFQKIHWDREYPTKIFRGMIRREQDFQILSIEASEKEDLGSLLQRYEMECRKLAEDYPLLCARIPLAETIDTGNTLAKDILKELMNDALRSKNPLVNGQFTILNNMRDEINRRSTGDKNTNFTPVKLASELTGCLRGIAGVCSIVLLISNTEKLVDKANKLITSGEWLMKNWLADEVRGTPGLIVVVTGENGLADVARWHENGVFHIPELEPMDLGNLVKWAREGYGFNWTEEYIKIIWKNNNTIAQFRIFLETTRDLIQRGAFDQVMK